MERRWGILLVAVLVLGLGYVGIRCSREQEKVQPGSKAGQTQEQSVPGKTTEGKTEVSQKWTCPMHPDVISDEPGQCPECHMDLVPMDPEGTKEESQDLDEEGTDGSLVKQWTCGMHPEIRSDEPGKCPICNMDLVPVEASQSGMLKIDPEELEDGTIGSQELAYVVLVRDITTSGRIAYDERRVKYVASRISGRVEKLYADFVGVDVSEGEPLLQIYSPDLITTLGELRKALDSSSRRLSTTRAQSMKALADAARSRLLLWGLSENDIEEALESDGARYQLTIRSPIDGTVIEKNAVEGKYVKEGENLFVVADLGMVWLIADVFEEDVGKIHIGDEVTATSRAFPDQVFHGKVAFIDPYVDENTRSVRVRMEIHNPDLNLKPGMFVEARIRVPVSRYANAFWTCPMHPDVKADEEGECPSCGMFLKEVLPHRVLAIPSEAVVFWGDIPVVYVEKQPGEFEPRQIKIDPVPAFAPAKQETCYPVLAGLMPGERIVTKGSFLIDSQARLTGAAASAYGGALKVKNSD